MAYHRPSMPLPKLTRQNVRLQFDGNIDTVSQQCDMKLSDTPLCYNLVSNKYNLANGYGVTYAVDSLGNNIDFDCSVKGVWCISNGNEKQLIVHLEDGKLYSMSEVDRQLTELSSAKYDTTFCAQQFETDCGNVLVLSDGNNYLILSNGVLQQVEAPSVKHTTVHYRRLFGASGADDTLYFSAPTDASDWTYEDYRAGYIKLANGYGNIVGLQSFKDSLYVFSQYGVTEVEAYAEPSEFELKKAYASAGKICGNSIAVCGDKIVYLTTKGLFAFDGNKTTAILGGLANLFTKNQQNCTACFHNGKYILAFEADFNDGQRVACEKTNFTNNALLIFDTVTQKYSIVRGIDIVSMYKSQDSDQLYLCVVADNRTKLGTLCRQSVVFGQILPQVRTLPQTDFGYSGKKFLQYIEVGFVKGLVKIVVTTDNGQQTFDLVEKSHTQKVQVRMEGTKFDIAIFSYSAQSEIGEIAIALDVSK